MECNTPLYRCRMRMLTRLLLSLGEGFSFDQTADNLFKRDN